MLKYLYDLSYGANYNIVGLLLAPKIVQTHGAVERWYSSPVEGCQAYAFSNHIRVLHNVTPIDLLVKSAIQYALPKRDAPVQTKSYTIQFMGIKTKWRKRFCSCRTVL